MTEFIFRGCLNRSSCVFPYAFKTLVFVCFASLFVNAAVAEANFDAHIRVEESLSGEGRIQHTVTWSSQYPSGIYTLQRNVVLQNANVKNWNDIESDSESAAVSISYQDDYEYRVVKKLTLPLLGESLLTLINASSLSVVKTAPQNTDGDEFPDLIDAFPGDPQEHVDSDGDGVGDNADLCPSDPLDAYHNNDGDELCDISDPDDDNDGVLDYVDLCPFDSSGYYGNFDGDELCDVADPDDDNDGVPDVSDAFALDASESVDTDGDGIGNNADLDDDGDGIPDSYEARFAELDSLNAEDALNDADGDGWSNLQEYRAGSNIEDKLDKPTLAIHSFTTSQSHIRSGEHITLSWNTWDADNVSLYADTGSGAIAQSLASVGSIIIAPKQSTTYQLRANNTTNDLVEELAIKVDSDAPSVLWKNKLNLKDGRFIATSISLEEDGSTYVGSLDNNFYKLKPNGDVGWIVEDAGIVMGKAAIDGDNLYIGTSGSDSHPAGILALSKNGDELWHVATDTAVMGGPVFNADKTHLYVANYSGTVFAVAVPGGALLWRYDIPGADSVVASPAISTDGLTLVVKTSANVYAIDIPKARDIFQSSQNIPQAQSVFSPNSTVSTPEDAAADGVIWQAPLD